MKRTRIEIADIVAYDNLALAAYKAGKGKRSRADVQAFFNHFDTHLAALRQAALMGELPYGRFRQFTIYDPKQRSIYAACFEDRVLHHAIMNCMEPILERALLPTTYACRPGKGALAAVQQVQRCIRRYPWYVKIDVEHYFDCINHGVLLALLKRRFKGEAFLALLQRIIASYQTQPGSGLPIGSLTSQHFANYYLDGLDRMIMETLSANAHVRYMDDVIWWVDSRSEAKASLTAVTEYLQQQRQLKIKTSAQINRSRHGVSYCGYRIIPAAIRLSRRKKRRYRQRRQYWEQAWAMGLISAQTLQRNFDAVYAMTAHTDSLGFRRENIRRFPPIEV